jgi:uncharacterized protein (TIGR03435 family)
MVSCGNGSYLAARRATSYLNLAPDVSITDAERTLKNIVFAAIVCLSCVTIAASQSENALHAEHAEAPSLTFSVATIKPSNPDSSGWHLEFTPDGFSARNVPLRKVIQEAYGIYEEERLSPGSDRIQAEKFDIEAKFDPASGVDFRNISLNERRSMLQALLTDRFKLSIHHELKELPVYALVIAKKGPKLQEAASDISSVGGIKGYDGLITHSGRGSLEVKSFAMSNLAQVLHYSVGRIVVDKTGLTGHYDFSLRWSSMSDAASTQPSSGPSIFTALQEQLGLKLEPMKYPVDTIVIDHVELPSEN